MRKITFLLLVLLISCEISENNDNLFVTKEFNNNDKRVTIILDEVTENWFNKNEYTFFKPTKSDISEIESILKKAIEKGKFDFLKEPRLISIKEYYRQYTCYIDENNQKIIRINAFCRIPQIPVEIDGKIVWEPFDWRNELVLVKDGGKCYWTAIINLSIKEFIELYVNGAA